VELVVRGEPADEHEPRRVVAHFILHRPVVERDAQARAGRRPEASETLGDLGYQAVPHNWEFGDLQIVWRDGDQLEPASDPRNRGESRVIRDLPIEPASR